MRFAKDRRLFRALQLASIAAALAALAGCQGPDPTKFACDSSAQCPGGYHCDLGTASTPASFKCVNGAPVPRTLAAEATKFLLAKRPSADGTVRTTITGNKGAVTSAPDFIGVRLVASQGGSDLADSAVQVDGSVLEFQLPQALTQVTLRVQDDSGHSVPVTGYSEQVELSFAGKEVAGNTNLIAAYDVTSPSDSLYPPATWISGGPGPGGRATEFTAADTLLPDGGIQSSASYTSIAYLDYETASTAAPALALDPSGGSPGSSVGWQEFAQTPTALNAVSAPPARVGATMASLSGVGLVAYGGATPDLHGGPVDPAGSFYLFNTLQGWTQVVPAAGARSLPSGGAKSSVALGIGGTTSCVSPCTQLSYQFSMAGGFDPTGAMTDKVVAFGSQSVLSANPTVTTTGWFDVGTLPFKNAGMASAPVAVPLSTAAQPQNGESVAGMVLVGGEAIVPGPGIAGSPANDASGCLLYAGVASSGVQNKVVSCADSNFLTTGPAGTIGFRTGMTVVAVDPSTVLLFGGNRTNGPAGTNGVKNDLWRGTLSCPAAVAPATCTTQMTWTQLSPTGTPPPARANAGGAIWETTLTIISFPFTFVFNRKLAIYGGSDATGALSDLWEYDITSNAWHQVPLDAGSALAPAARTKFAMAGDGGHAYLFGGSVGTTPTDQMWVTTRETAARLLVKAPLALPAIDQATGMKIAIDAAGLVSSQAFLWDGTKWRFVGTSTSDSATGFHLLASPTAPATGFLQPDGNIYLLLMGTGHATTQFGGSAITVDRLKMTVDFK